MSPFLYTFFGGSKYSGGRQFFKFLKKIFYYYFKFLKKYIIIIISSINIASFRRGYKENILF